jgi:hypothetical protein
LFRCGYRTQHEAVSIHIMKRLLAKALTPICSSLIYLLHNRNTFSFNRLELQSVLFSFSQFGEDLAVCRLADQLGLANGVYVDAGAYHPIFGSNTLLLSKKLLSVELFQDDDRKKIENFLHKFHYRLESRIALSGIFVAQ